MSLSIYGSGYKTRFLSIGQYLLHMTQKFLLRKHFDLLRISYSTVPLYADEYEMLVFVPFLTVCQRAKKQCFLTRWKDTLSSVSVSFCQFSAAETESVGYPACFC